MTFQRLQRQSGGTCHWYNPWPLDPEAWGISISSASPNFTFHHWKNTSRKDFQTGFQPNWVRGAQQSANINAISGGWDKKGGVDNGCFGQSVNRYTQGYDCSTLSILPPLNVFVCSHSLAPKNCLFYTIWLYLHDNGVGQLGWCHNKLQLGWDAQF